MRSEVWSGCGASARARNPRRSGSGHHSLRYYGRGVGWQDRTGNAHPILNPRKHGLELSRDGSPGESRGRSAGRRARPDMARSRARGISRRQRLLMLRGRWLACAFRRFASLWGGDEPCSVVVEENSDAIASRERFRTSSLPGLTRQSIESVGLLRFAVLFNPCTSAWTTGSSPVVTTKRAEGSRHCERSEAIQEACAAIWIALSLSLLAMTNKSTT
jgi:hypothetical protein